MMPDIKTLVIVCPLLFLAGLVDAIGGGGGLISLPAYLIAGVPIHAALATNKFSSSSGTALATYRFIKNHLVSLKLSIPTVMMAMIGATIGAKLSLLVDEGIMKYILFFILPITAFVVLNKKLFHDTGGETVELTRKTYLIASASALIIGVYDGFYGPGTGTFLLIILTVFAKLSVQKANAQAKVINLTTNLSSLVVFLLNGQVLFILGIAAAVCNMIGGYIGAGLVMNKGTKIVKPSIILVLVLLLLKIMGVY